METLTEHLRTLGHDVFIDKELKGSQLWWDAILDKIRGCDAVVAILSAPALDSVACRRERAYAAALGKPILPIAVEQVSIQALPRELSVRNVVDYSKPGETAAYALAGALDALPEAPLLPSPLPNPPDTPLSYLSELIDQVDGAAELSGNRQWQILDELEPALLSSDPEEREGAESVLGKLTRRPELRANVEHRISTMRSLRPQPPRGSHEPSNLPLNHPNPQPPPPPPLPPPQKTSKVLIAFAILGVIFVLLILLSMCSESGGY